MWHFEHTEQTSATPEQLWAHYSEPTAWPQWDHGTAEVTVEGPFVVGTRGTLKPAKGPKAAFVLTEVTPLVSFTDTTKLPLTTMEFAHRIEVIDGVTHFTHSVTMNGALTPLFSRLIGRTIAAELPDAMRALAELAPVRR
ncbi:SRPBCC family protein [Kribbella sp. CA-253562]|uniref:SRPBCC family protein n=1 Tax=Kribbella sp. CA-253562 TaxID=3239942 RepID=UPI003D8E1F32